MHFSWYTEDIFDCVRLHHAAFLSFLVRWFAVCLRSGCRPAMKTPAVFAFLQETWNIFDWFRQKLAMLAWLGGRSSCRASVSARLQSVNALRSDPSQLYVSSCPNLDWVRLISVDRVKEKANSSAQTFVSDRRQNRKWDLRAPPATSLLHELIFNISRSTCDFWVKNTNSAKKMCF